MAIETSRNNRSVKISKTGSPKLSIHEQGGGKRVSPLGVPAAFHMGHAASCIPMPTGVAERLPRIFIQ